MYKLKPLDDEEFDDVFYGAGWLNGSRENKLDIRRGSVGISLLGRSEIWTRIK